MESNIFRVLRVEKDEVMMCRYLADLLDPRGLHPHKTRFLESFLRDVIKLKKTVLENAQLERTCVMTEYRICGERRIDIMLTNPAFAVPIEVKIDAQDQPGQCYDYDSYARNAPLVYLTKWGTPPSPWSMTAKDGTILPNDKIRLVSWVKICDWLEKGSEIPIQVRQYTEAIRSFLSGAGRQAEKEQICNVLEAFRCEIEQSAAKHRGQLEDPEFFYHSYQKWKNESLTAFCPGLNYHVKGVVFPQQGRQMWFRIEVSDDGHLVAGFCLMNVENRAKVDTAALTANEMKELRRFLDPLIILPNNWWIVWRFSNGKQDASRGDVPNFKSMNRCAMHLLDEEKRTKFAQEAFQIFEDQLLGYLKPFSERSCD